MEMLPLIKIVPEMNLSLDPTKGTIGASMGRDIILLSMDDINEQIDLLEEAADDFMNSLDPTTTSVDSFPGREGAYLTTGLITNVTYGFIVALFFMVAIILF